MRVIRTVRGQLAALVLAAGLSGAPAGVAAQDDEGVRGIVHQQLVALLNPMGMEHGFRAGFRARLGDPEELLFTGTHAEAGAVSYVSPVYAYHGGYLQVSPLAFLVLRAEITGTVLWPIGMDGSGYFGLEGYDADVHEQSLPADAASSAIGWNISLLARLQGAVPLGDGVQLLVADQIEGTHVALGDAPYHLNPKHDAVLAQQDWVVTNDAIAFVDIRLEPGTSLRVGAYSNMRWVPRSGYVGHQVGPMASLAFERPSAEVSALNVFLRGGGYTHHGPRQDEATILGGVSVAYDLGRIR